MWHEVRKQERKIRCMIVDYKRRAERRKDYYEKIKADPTQFIQIHGRPCKIHLDPAVAAAGDSPAIMMGWQGGQDVIIDRFDVRAHLDYIPEVKQKDNEEDLSYDDRQVNYERYRILAQNDFLGVSEEKFLHQIYLEEQFGAIPRANEVPIEGKKKVPGATIGYNYDDPSTTPLPIAEDVIATEEPPVPPVEENEDDDDSDLDFDMCVDVNKVTTQQAHELNSCALIYGMEGNDFFSFLTKDKEEAETLRLAKELEEEKAMYSGRKSRRERRAYREKKLAGRKISPPSYASRKSPTYRDYRDIRSSHSKSRSASPVNSGQITYITSFGGDEPPPTTPHMTKSNSHRRRSRSRSRSKSRTRSYSSAKPSSSSSLRHRNRSRSRSRSKSKNRSSSRKSSEHSNTATR
ncbi:hypothetical protein AAG570_008640 [Ranatra chinensis]|uniref:Suppressor of white apricot N-terminal domain-containing protein n=1 Tax=Ranatra chinensis TaxID=642074 RepID=A0ABD0Z4D1_9HEMI